MVLTVNRCPTPKRVTPGRTLTALPTAMSPLQYQKHLRLHEARRILLTEAVDATTAAIRVGYESATQFNREYKRSFGAPPMRDVQSSLAARIRPTR